MSTFRRCAFFAVTSGAIAFLPVNSPVYGHDAESHEKEEPVRPGFSLHGYGVINYYAFKWDTDPERRNRIDVERLVLYPSASLSKNIAVRAEIEFEHGGTGSTMEFDRFEEFGEYEMEIEKGGEVELDQLHVQIHLSEAANFRIGRIKLPLGLIASHHEPTEYFTATRSEMETSLIPSPWYENGIEFFGSLFSDRRLWFNLLIVNGLDATGFSSANWVAPGHQMRFESVNADNLAIVAGLNCALFDDITIGGSFYYGNSTDNRPKPDLTVPAHVTVYEAHASWEEKGLAFRAMGLYGTLQNADVVSKANRNVSNNLNVKRTPVGSAAAGYFVEAGYNVMTLGDSAAFALVPFVRWEYYDSMAKITGDVFDNPRWERRELTAGFNIRPVENFIIKLQYSDRKVGIPTMNHERTFSFGIGFEFE